MFLSGLKRRFRKYFTKVYDPEVEVRIGNQQIRLNWSHQLPDIMAQYPDYNYNLARMVTYCEAYFNQLSIIDIGANVGDTVAFIRNLSQAPILCIDGEENYVRLLKRNTAQWSNVNVCHALVGTENREENVKLTVTKGTAHLQPTDNPVKMRTLENILSEFPDFKQSKLIKSDTDGYDTWILRSCRSYLETVNPVLFFEFDPHFIRKNNDDPFAFISYLQDVGYHYFLFYTNVGDLLLGCSMDERPIIDQLIHYYSGRKIEIFMDICAFHKKDEALFRTALQKEIAHFQTTRGY